MEMDHRYHVDQKIAIATAIRELSVVGVIIINNSKTKVSNTLFAIIFRQS